MVELSDVHRSPALLIEVLIEDLCALAPGLIMVTSCLIEMSFLCFREGMIQGELKVCLHSLQLSSCLFSNNKEQV